MNMMRTVFAAASLAAITAAASAGSVGVDSFGALDAGVNIGSGISNDNFTINSSNTFPGQLGLKAIERFTGDLVRTENTYFAEPGESNTSGAAGAPVDPGKATWNYFMSVDLGSFNTFADVDVIVSIDFDPAVDNTNVFQFNLADSLASQNIDISGLSLFQSSENLGFDFWALAYPDAADFNPYAPGEYSMSIEVFDGNGFIQLSVAMDVVVADPAIVPLPTAGVAGLAGLTLLGARRRRNAL
jgi:hypothetical protein